jgi:hypothetical protein
MTAYAMGFIFVMSFTVMVGIGAVIFISFDAKASANPKAPAKTTTQRLYNIVRRINTETIETVDTTGTVQQWTRLPQ